MLGARLGAGVTLPVLVEEALGSCGGGVGSAEPVGDAEPVAGWDGSALLLPLPLPLGEGEARGEALALGDAEGGAEARALPLLLRLPPPPDESVEERDAEDVWLRLRDCVREAGALGDTEGERLSRAERVGLMFVAVIQPLVEGEGEGEALAQALTECEALVLREAEVVALGSQVAEGLALEVAARDTVGAAVGASCAVARGESVALRVEREESEGAGESEPAEETLLLLDTVVEGAPLALALAEDEESAVIGAIAVAGGEALDVDEWDTEREDEEEAVVKEVRVALEEVEGLLLADVETFAVDEDDGKDELDTVSLEVAEELADHDEG